MDMIAFIGGGNMASSIVGGLVRSGRAAERIVVVDPGDAAREKLAADFGVRTLAAADTSLAEASLVVWAVKPQLFADAARTAAPHVGHALQLSVMAGIRSDAICRATDTERVVRTMPNTPALVGRGMTGLFARAAAGAGDRASAESVLAATGELLWVDSEDDLDAVTALSGSGPAYVFYLIEAMTAAATRMGLADAAGRQLAIATLAGSTELARASGDAPATLRQRVTSPGGTTFAAVSVLEARGVKAAFVEAIEAARQRARELGDEFGG